jgi:tetratricopeptide (TPR) repeat protein
MAEQRYRGAVEDDPQSGIAHLALGNFLFQTGRTADAEDELKKATALGSDTYDAKSALAFLYASTNRLDLAEKAYTDLANSRPEGGRGQIILADFYLDSKNPKKSIEILEKVYSDFPDNVAVRRKLANLYFDRNDVDKASRLADEVIKKNANDPEANLIKGRILLVQNKPAEAATQLQALVKKQPLPTARYFLGIAYNQLHDDQKAVTEFKAVIQNSPNFAPAYIALAVQELSAGDVQSAVEHARQGVTLAPQALDSHLLLVRTYIRANEFEAAGNELDTLVKNNPGNAAVLHHLGILYAAKGNQEQAEAQFEAALKAEPRQLESLSELANVYFKGGRPEKAVQRINQAISEQPNNPGLYQLLAQTYLALKDKTKAEQAYEKALSLNPGDSNQQIGLASFYLSAGDFDKGISKLQALVNKEPDNVAAQKRLAELYANKKDYAKAIQISDDLLKKNGKDTDALVFKARLLLADGKTSEGVAALQAAVKNDPASAAAHYYLGATYLQNNDRQKAEAEWASALATAGGFIQPYIAMARLKMDSGDPVEAAKLARQAVAINPNSIDAQMIVAMTSGSKDDFKRAMDNVEQAVKQNPNENLEVQIGGAYLGQGDLATAESRFEAVLKVDPESQDANRGLARVYLTQGKPEKAISRLSALAQNSKKAWPQRLMAEVYVFQKNFPKAEEAYQRAIALEPDNAANKIALAELYAASGAVDRGISAYEDLIKTQPSNMLAKHRLAGFYLSQRSFDKAIRVSDDILKSDDKDTEARIIKGRAYLAQQNSAQATQELLAAATKDPKSAAARLYLGVAYLQAGKTPQAEDAWTEAARLDSRLVEPHLALAESKLRAGDFASAVREAKAAIQINPNQFNAHVLLGNAYLQNKDVRNAVAEFESLVSQMPRNTIAHERLAAAYLAQDNTAKAQSQVDEALKIDPTNMDALGQLANILVLQKKTDVAIQRVDQQIKGAPQQPRLYDLLGRLYLNQKNYPKAEEAFRKTLAIDKNSFTTYAALSQVLMLENSPDKAGAVLEDLLKVNPKSAEAHVLLGSIAEGRHDSAAALSHYKEALKIDPQSPIAANNLAYAMAESGQNLDEALKLAQIAKQQMPENATVTDTMGWVYYKKGAFATAVDLFKECVKKDDKSAVYQYHLGVAYFKSGDRYNARWALSQAITLDPKFPGAEDAKNLLGTIAQKP